MMMGSFLAGSTEAPGAYEYRVIAHKLPSLNIDSNQLPMLYFLKDCAFLGLFCINSRTVGE